MNVRVLEAPDDLDDRVHFADVGQELVAEAFALAGALDEPGDVDELDRRGNDDVRLRDALQRRQPRIGYGHDADVRVDRAEGIIGRLRLSRARDGVEQGGLADVGKTDDTGSEHSSEDIGNPRSGHGRPAACAESGSALAISWQGRFMPPPDVSKKKIRWSAAWLEARDLIWRRRWRLVLGFALVIINTLSGFVLPWTTKDFIDKVIGQQQTGLLNQLALVDCRRDDRAGRLVVRALAAAGDRRAARDHRHAAPRRRARDAAAGQLLRQDADRACSSRAS